MVLSVTEGEDKPLKYPDMFAAADLMLLNKSDLLPHLDFDVGPCLAHALQVNPNLQTLVVSAQTGEGLPAFYAWIEGRAARLRARRPTSRARSRPDERRRARRVETTDRRACACACAARCRASAFGRSPTGSRRASASPASCATTPRACCSRSRARATREFVDGLRREPPPLARIDRIEVRANCRRRARRGFSIERERGAAGRATRIVRRRRHLRDVSRRAVRPGEPLSSLSVHQLHPLRPALHADAPPALRPRADVDGAAFRMCADCARDYRDPAEPPLPCRADRLSALRPAPVACSIGEIVGAACARAASSR